MLLTSSLAIDILLLFLVAIFLLHKYVSKNYDYWKKRGVSYMKPMPFIGNLYDVLTFKSMMHTWQKDVYNSTKEPYIGIFIFHKPILVLRSPELIKQVLMKDFHNFSDRTVLCPDHDQLVGQALFFSKNEDWKIMRSKVTPIFSPGKIKAMFSIINDIGKEMGRYIKNNQGQLESKELSSKFSTEVSARISFGIRAHCFEDENCHFREIGRRLFDFRWRSAFNQTAYFFMQGLANFFRLEFVDRKAAEYLKKIMWETITQREKTNDKGNDIIDVVVELRKNKEFCDKYQFEEDRVLAQPFQVFAGATETTSQIISFTLYELCINRQIQNRLREEILYHINENGDVTYEGLKDFKYLEMCIFESLRKYPVLPFLDRQCKTEWTIPGTDIVIDEKAAIYIPLPGLHSDEKYFPEPQKYDPERFADRSIYNQNGLYYLPFGDGPRICLGERLAMMSVKLALIHILTRFEIEPTSATPIPLKFAKKGVLLLSDVGLPMRYVEYDPTKYQEDTSINTYK